MSGIERTRTESKKKKALSALKNKTTPIMGDIILRFENLAVTTFLEKVKTWEGDAK